MRTLWERPHGPGTQNSAAMMPTGWGRNLKAGGGDGMVSVSVKKAAQCDQLLLQESTAPVRVKKPGCGSTTGSGN